MKSIFAAVAALTVAVVSAQSNIVSVTSPLTGTVYTAGQPAVITWIDQQVPVIPKIVLAKGSPTALQPVSTIAQDVDANTGSYTWNVPADIAAGDDYAFELGNSPNISFTGLFTIKSADSAGANTASPAATTNASGSSSASGSVASASVSVVANARVAESAGFKVSSNKAAMGAIAVAGAAAAALI
ncbi:Ser-Thr-rich glycosyl-phosphatidyl-inositol-anchored membrane family-domain-containing protein [Parasitella parasitica]|nr:Ser-Thr-rich glycosyl-phosphatidyl-inositol-anchored membrane family-domain-containing protein [Parasitella parasitica]